MVKMQWLCRVTLATLAQGGYCCSRSPCRLWSSGGRPPVPLGGRILTDPDCVFQHNMWDHVQWSEEEMQEARRKTEENSSERIPREERAKYEKDASQFWDGFYETHQNKFFKDRRWLFQEFPELLPSRRRSDWPVDANADSNPAAEKEEEEGLCITRAATGQPDKEEVQPGKQEVLPSNRLRPGAGQSSDFPGELASFRILEVGCGAGNSVFPISKAISGRGAFLYCCDFSSRAVQLVKDHPDYDDSLCHAFVQDVCDETDSFPFPPHSLDIILLVFVLSAIQPHRVQGVVNRLSSYLKPGGVVLFRDYGRYDLSQLRFKKGQCLSENFYSRHDGTCVYFFTKEEVHDLFSSAGLVEEQNLEDRRLKVNRAKKVVMRRVWMQSKFRKPLQPLQTC